MVTNFQKETIVRFIALSLLITSTFSVMHAQATSDPSEEILDTKEILSLDGNTLTSFQPENWDVQLDTERGPILFPKNREALSSLFVSAPSNWSALGSNLAGTNGALSDPGS